MCHGTIQAGKLYYSHGLIKGKLNLLIKSWWLLFSRREALCCRQNDGECEKGWQPAEGGCVWGHPRGKGTATTPGWHCSASRGEDSHNAHLLGPSSSSFASGLL